ncbi:hypothetical protein O181_038603 [Austropuccinia psidii MF-1]|uniref:Uncharacterized protein n=1 Tax=Austropuccinia psidii MF-1 TaxID=1389203 RepID=A0A9Q3DBR1_9BASI|nr:hypothetical protein [Austropuccinia psidii MF-1]
MNFCIYNDQHPLIIENGANFSIMAREYLEKYSPNWEKKLFSKKAKSFKRASGKMTSIGTIIKEIITTHRQGHIGLNPEFGVLEDAHIQGFLLETDYQRMYGIVITTVRTGILPWVKTRKTNFHLKYTRFIAKIPSKNYLINSKREDLMLTLLVNRDSV